MASHSNSTAAPARRAFLAGAAALTIIPALPGSAVAAQDPMVCACTAFRALEDRIIFLDDPEDCARYLADLRQAQEALAQAVPSTLQGVMVGLAVAREQMGDGKLALARPTLAIIDNCIAALGSLA